QHEHQAAFAQAKPQQGQGQQRNSGQRAEHGRQRRQHVAAQARGNGQRGQQEGQRDAGRITLEQHRQRLRRARRQLAVGQASRERLGGLPGARQQLVVARIAGGGLPQQGQRQQDDRLAQRRVLAQPFMPGQRRLGRQPGQGR